MVAKLKSQ